MKRGCYQGDRHGNCDVGDFHLEEDQSPQRHPLRRHDRGSSSFALLDMIEDVVSSYKAPIFLGPASPQQLRRERIAERIMALQELVPTVNKVSIFHLLYGSARCWIQILWRQNIDSSLAFASGAKTHM
ncbi:hypothetical protein Bca101_034500 [Brassica carinata]